MKVTLSKHGGQAAGINLQRPPLVGARSLEVLDHDRGSEDEEERPAAVERRDREERDAGDPRAGPGDQLADGDDDGRIAKSRPS